MLPREKGGVVDASLKVYGTKNVRVADLSTLPLMTAAHTQCKFRLRPMGREMLTLELSYYVRHCRARYVALSLSYLVCLRVSQNLLSSGRHHQEGLRFLIRRYECLIVRLRKHEKRSPKTKTMICAWPRITVVCVMDCTNIRGKCYTFMSHDHV